MATITGLTPANSTTSGATLDVTGITAAVGDWLILECAADNAGASGVSSTSATITDAAGNTWTRQSVTNYTPGGAANDGTTQSVWTCPVTNALSSATVTINFSPNTTAKAVIGWRVVPDTGKSIFYHSVGAGASGSGTALDAPTVSVAQGLTIWGLLAIETLTLPGVDTDTTNGIWSSGQSSIANTGTATTSQLACGQYKTVTATGNQSYGRTAGGSRDWAGNWLILGEAVSGTLAATEAQDAANILGIAGPIGILGSTERPDRASFTLAPGWPTSLPLPTLQGYTFAPAAAVKRQPVEIGAARVYRRTRKPPIDVAVAWQLDADQQALLDAFQSVILQEGQNEFSITLALPGGLATAVARFKDKLAIRARGGPRWQTTATLELLSRPIMTDAELTAIIGAGTDWPTSILPHPTLDSWELTPKPAVARSGDLPGYPDARQRSRNSTTEVPASWEMSATQAAIFDAFFTHRAKDGAAWFDFPIVQAIGTHTTKVRFMGEADWTPRGGGRWAVTAPLEIRERAMMTAAQYSAAL